MYIKKNKEAEEERARSLSVCHPFPRIKRFGISSVFILSN